ncbi:hypothetical protein QTP88_001988 [Uroleucon formosanum]
MSEDIVTFHIRCEKALFELKVKSPIDVSVFITKLKNELKLDESDDLVMLCPVSDDGKMKLQYPEFASAKYTGTIRNH